MIAKAQYKISPGNLEMTPVLVRGGSRNGSKARQRVEQLGASRAGCR